MNSKRKRRKMMTFKPTINLKSMIPSSSAKFNLLENKFKKANNSDGKNSIVKKNKYFGKDSSSSSIQKERGEEKKFRFPPEGNEETQNVNINRGVKKRLTRRQKRMMTVQLLNQRKRIPSINYEPESNMLDDEGKNNNQSPDKLSKDDKRKMFKNRFRSMTFQEKRRKDKDLKNSSKLLIINEE